MGFGIFILLMDSLIPVTMIGFGKMFLNSAPKKINMTFGYRTGMSVKNRDTWEFAHKYCGKIWYVSGIVLLPLLIVSMLFVLRKNEDTTGTLGLIICIIQLIPLVGAGFPA